MRRSARTGPRRARLPALRLWAAQGSVCPRRCGASHRFCCFLAVGRCATPLPALPRRLLKGGRPCPAVPSAASAVEREPYPRIGGQRRYRGGFAARM